MSNILYSPPTYKNPLVNIPPAQSTTKILFKVLRVQHEDIFQKQSAESQKVKKQTTTGRNAFWFSQLIGFQQVVESLPRVLLIPKGVCLRFSDVWHFLQKRFLCFYMIQVVIIYLLPPPDTYVIYYTISSNQFLLISDS